jgi:RNA polymerase sigma-70 factor, ECF subfamily
VEVVGCAPADLVRRAGGGDIGAFDALYRLHIGKVEAYLQAALGNSDDVQEVAQCVFLKVYEALPRYRRGERPFDHWLFTIVRNTTINFSAKQGRSVAVPPEDIDRRRDQRGREPGAEWGDSPALHAALGGLPNAQRKVIVLHYLAGLTTGEIATVMDLRTDHVRQLKRRGLDALRRSASLPRPVAVP